MISHSLFTPSKLITSFSSMSKALMSWDSRSETAPFARLGWAMSQVMLDMCVYKLSECL